MKGMFSSVDLQWFADGEQEEQVEVSEEEPEVVIVDEEPKEEEAPKKPVADPELEKLRQENAELRARGDTGTVIKEGFTFLQEKLSAAGVPAQPPAPVEDEDKFWEGVEQGLFDKAPREALKKAIDKQARKLVRDELGPLIVSQMESAFENAEWRLRNDAKDGEIFRTYEREVYAELHKLPPLQQKDPRALREVFARVKGAHVDDILDAREKARAEKKVETPAPRSAVRPAVYMAGDGTHLSEPPKKKVYLTRAEDARRNRLGMTVKDFLELKESRKASK